MQLVKAHKSLQDNMLDIGPAVRDPNASPLLYIECKFHSHFYSTLLF